MIQERKRRELDKELLEFRVARCEIYQLGHSEMESRIMLATLRKAAR